MCAACELEFAPVRAPPLLSDMLSARRCQVSLSLKQEETELEAAATYTYLHFDEHARM